MKCIHGKIINPGCDRYTFQDWKGKMFESCESGCDPKARAELAADRLRLREVQKRMTKALGKRR